VDRLGSGVSNVLDVHATLLTVNEGRSCRLSVKGQGEVQLFLDTDLFYDVNCVAR
jgi:hypothetical protein